MSSLNERWQANEALADVVGSTTQNDAMDTSENDTRQVASSAVASNINDEEDEVVREIPVFLSPALSQNLQLIQYPLQQHHQEEGETSGAPSAVRIKQRHCMMEVDYPTPENIHVQGAYHMAERTFSSHTVPISTHMAMGKLLPLDRSQGTASSSASSNPNVGLFLVPLSRITQLRPNFSHIDEETSGTAGIVDDERLRQEHQQEQDNGARKPVSFQKKESERAALARKSSYAFKKASEDAEQWHSLEIHNAASATAASLMERVRCPHPQQQLLDSATLIKDTAKHTAARSLNERYVNSMNYLPSTEQHQENGTLVIDDTSHEDTSEITNIVSKLVKTMHLGFPIPFSLLRAQFVDAVSDETLFAALGSCALLVRGNFCLASRLMAMPPAMAQARTFLLFLFQSMRVVHRQRLEHVFATPQINGTNGNINDPNSESVTPAMIGMLLNQVGKKTAEGWVLKVDDDPSFAQKYPDTLLAHAHHWTRVMEHFKPMLQRYREPIGPDE